MMKHCKCIQVFLALLIAAVPVCLFAKEAAGNDSLPAPNVFAGIGRSMLHAGILSTDLQRKEEEVATELQEIEVEYEGTGNNMIALHRLLRTMQVKKIFRNEKTKRRLYTDMANVTARLRLYPAAMQLFYESVDGGDSSSNKIIWAGNEDQLPGFDLMNDTAITGISSDWEKESVPEDASLILRSFDDGKEAAACALVVHVKQPVPGRRNAFAGLNNVGHMFITLIKYNTDKTIVSSSFGFYPQKQHLFSATPVQPVSMSVIKDDALHGWDEVAGKFISYRRLLKILKLLNKYDNKKYHLNSNNCTDFGLQAAMIGGIDIRESRGKWPFGRGNNPASAGQSILEGKIINTDTGTKQGLFLCNGKAIAFGH